jgi:hypothetical protein
MVRSKEVSPWPVFIAMIGMVLGAGDSAPAGRYKLMVANRSTNPMNLGTAVRFIQHLLSWRIRFQYLSVTTVIMSREVKIQSLQSVFPQSRLSCLGGFFP